MRFLGLIAVLMFAGIVPAAAEKDVELSEADIAAVAERLERYGLGRYMETKPDKGKESCRVLPKNARPAGWESVEVERCTYHGRVDKGKEKPLLVVIMANASPDRLARWLLTACVDIGAVKGDDQARCLARLRAHVKSQSGFQFPVAGLVDETKLDNAGMVKRGLCTGICYFTFRDGVAVRIPGFGDPKGDSAGTVDRAIKAFDITSTTRGEKQAIEAKVTDPGKFARIASTTREDLDFYYGGQDKPPYDHRADFLLAVRKHYQDALGSNRNVLISAFARHQSLLTQEVPDEQNWKLED